MPACLVNSQITNDAVEQCAGYILLTPVDFQRLQFLADLLVIPDKEALQVAFMAGITLPLIAYLTAWAFAQAINFLQRS